MTAKEYLRQIKMLSIKIKQLERELIEYRSTMALPAMADGEKVQTSRSGDNLQNSVLRALEMEDAIKNTLMDYLSLRREITGQIQGLDNPLHVEILYRRYCEFNPLEKIAVDLNYSYFYIKRQHGRALQNFAHRYLKEGA